MNCTCAMAVLALAPCASAQVVLAQATVSDGAPLVRFTVRVENVSTPTTLRLPDGSAAAIPVSPGVWAVHTAANPLLSPGQVEAGMGLEGLAEAGIVDAFASSLAGVPGVRASGTFEKPLAPLIRVGGMKPRRNMPAAAATAGVSSRMLQPGLHFEFTIEARPGDRLSMAMMVAQSNDGVIATGPEGIVLFEPDGRPRTGDVTAQLAFWDAGTEVNETPGTGRNQGLRQGAPHAGDPERRPVRPMAEAEFGPLWPPVGRIVRITLAPAGG